MSFDTDVASVSALLTTVDTISISPGRMVKIIDQAVAMALMTSGQPVISLGVSGKSVTISFDQARLLRKHYQDLDDAENSNMLIAAQPYFVRSLG